MASLGLLSTLRGILQGKRNADIENIMSKLHYRVTTTVLFSFCLIVTTNTLVGDPISCIVDRTNPKLSDKVINTYCWIHTTFTIPNRIYKERDTHFPGISNYNRVDTITYHAYYQWVPFMLFLQGLMFYAPHYFWKTLEGGRLQSIVTDFSTPIFNSEERRKRIKQLADYLQNSLWRNNTYVIKYLICEFLYLLNCIINIVLIDKFLNGMFITYGTDVLSYNEVTDHENKIHPMIALFPRMAKCSMNMYGSSGSIERHDFLCVLAVNVVNEKIYLIMWFWLFFLISMSSNKKVNVVIQTFNQMGDIFILSLLKKNIDSQYLELLVTELSARDTNNLEIKSNEPKILETSI
uniref:Innexin n=1 Tax=Melicertus latisulcatus majanivirus TaxID=2984277 RepID=A0A9C7CES8_9VIRU|nr:MAG: innexin [Marsupenaeus japonicus endogenous nimavirus]BDT62322.1 MAG: innexin [Melicertus latisulcatus majanivirus]